MELVNLDDPVQKAEFDETLRVFDNTLFDPNQYASNHSIHTSLPTTTIAPHPQHPWQIATSPSTLYSQTISTPSIPWVPPVPQTDRAVDELAEKFGIPPVKDEGKGPYLYGEKGVYSLLGFLCALLARVEDINLCPECGSSAKIEPGEYLCGACRNA